ncbi:MAG TPA: aldose epimerase family protein [Dinghuibacter sp.]|uniref:aldose epimerase family protein n=1 Tax=Dinghuibacter sp. TaxID=2024697 RepID=UPI002BDE1B27|nr:aldose epimerase family protein [Dinghuibacter sp.]HTJ14298.1 aldose epimerase family protein [Dinghuibacter sp.]
MMKKIVFFAAIAATLASCGGGTQEPTAKTGTDTVTGPTPNPGSFADTIDGKPVQLYTLQNGPLKATLTNYGGRLVSLSVPDSSGKSVDVVDGFDSVAQYRRARSAYFGALIGRYGNRIGKGQFKLGGKPFQIPVNNGPNALHGGTRGFDDYVWDGDKKNDSTLELKFLSRDGDMGFPGNLSVKVTYTLQSNGLKIEYNATTDAKTVCNLTNHAYWNLNGAGNGTILRHKLQIYGTGYTPVDSGLIPTGTIDPVKGTPFDFTQPTAIGDRINQDNVQLKNGKGYDHNWVIGDGKPSGTLRHAATFRADQTGIVMDIYTMEPGLQFYSGNFMDGALAMKYGKTNAHRSAFAAETQHFPDSPNEPQWPSTELDPGKTYHTVTVYQFSIRK